ncbi:MAG: ATP/GTP-binding protein [Bacillota bacterium]
MKIVLTGAQGVGKSTLAKRLAEVLGYPLIEEQARVAAAELGIAHLKDLKHNPELGIRFQKLCLEKQINAEDAAGENFVSDRTVMDNMLYWLKWHQAKAKPKENIDYYRQVKKRAQNYDLVVYLPVGEFPIENDGFRSPDPEYQEEMEHLLLMIIAYCKPHGIIRITGSIEERLKKVMSRLSVEKN